MAEITEKQFLDLEGARIMAKEIKNRPTKEEMDNAISTAVSGGEIDLSGYATKTELAGKADKTELAGKADKTELAGKADKTDVETNYLKKTDAEDTYQPKGEYQTKGDYPTKSEMQAAIAAAQLEGEDVDLSGYATKTDLDGKADKSDLAGKADKSTTVSTVDYNASGKKITKTINGSTTDVVSAAQIVTDGGGITSHQDISGKADKTDVETNYLKKTDAEDTYQPKGSYLTSHQDISGKADKTDVETNYLKKTDAEATYQRKGEYPTKSEMQAAIAEAQLKGDDDGVDLSGYATKTDLDGKADKSELAGKADKTATVSTVGYDATGKKITKTINGSTTDVVSAAQIVADGGGITSHQDISGKADKTATVSTVGYDATGKKITKTINGSTTDVVSAAQIVADGGGITSHQDISGKADKTELAGKVDKTDVETNYLKKTDAGATYQPKGNYVTQVKIGTAAYDPANGIVILPEYPTSLPASKLTDNSTYTAWGQPFFKNGVPVNVSGNLTDVGSITLKKLSQSSGSDPKIEVIHNGSPKLGLNLGNPETGGALVSRLGFVDMNGNTRAHICVTKPTAAEGDKGSLQFVAGGGSSEYALDSVLFVTEATRYRFHNDGLKIEGTDDNGGSYTFIDQTQIRTNLVKTDRISGIGSSAAYIKLTVEPNENMLLSANRIKIGKEVQASDLGAFGFEVAGDGYSVAADKYNTVINNNGAYYIRYATDSDIVKNVSEDNADWDSYRFLIDKNNIKLKTSPNTSIALDEKTNRISFVGTDFRFVRKKADILGGIIDGQDTELYLNDLQKEVYTGSYSTASVRGLLLPCYYDVYVYNVSMNISSISFNIGMAISGSKRLYKGFECTVLLKSSDNKDHSAFVASDSTFITPTGETMEIAIPAQGYAEVNFLYVGDNQWFVRSV